jgi:hypothetical protein
MIPVSQSVVYDCSVGVVPTCANVQGSCESATRLVALHFVPFVWSGLFGMLYTWMQQGHGHRGKSLPTVSCPPLRTKEPPFIKAQRQGEVRK